VLFKLFFGGDLGTHPAWATHAKTPIRRHFQTRLERTSRALPMGTAKRGQIYLNSHEIGRSRITPKMGRVILPNHPHHVVQRGHNPQAIFAEPGD
jgi:hypothetical protein